MDMNYGRNRRSIQDLEQELYDIFEKHPQSTVGQDNQPVIPGDALVDILRTFSRNHEFELMNKDEEEQLKALLASNPGVAVTPQVLLQFVAMRTTISPRQSPDVSPPEQHVSLQSSVPPEGDDDERYNRKTSYSRSHSRSSSRDSTNTSTYGPSSRPPSRASAPPKTPTDSPLDASRRQRSTPLEVNVPPSSWSRRPPPSRRKSDAGRNSDSESSGPPALSRSYSGRTRAPSNPSSPASDFDFGSTVGSPTSGPYSRPHSRTQSQPQSHFAPFGSPSEHDHPRNSHATASGLMSPPPSDISFDDDLDFDTMRISSLPIPSRSGDDSSDEEQEMEETLGLIMDRSAASSLVTLDIQERLEALRRTNADLGRKLVEAERTLQNRLTEHDLELEEMQMRLEETKAELTAAKREEKELRSKEKVNTNQIAALESEVAKVGKALENAKNSYQSLQKQYHEQCNESERYRETLRRRDEQIKTMKEQADNSLVEAHRWEVLRQTFESQINALHEELDQAQQTTVALDEQKQENLLLKETIDRMRFEMDEMRTNASGTSQGGGTGSVRGSVSKSLGAELLSKMKQLGDEGWGVDDDEPEEDPHADMDEVSEMLDEDDDTESEDVIQTIITRTKRKVTSRAKTLESVRIEEVKEYSDAQIQHNPITSTSSTQTDPEPVVRRSSFSTQTDSPRINVSSTQTDPEPTPAPIVRLDAEIQTDIPEPEPEPEPETATSGLTSSSAQTESDDETLASSSSTLLPPTPKAQTEHLHSHDMPPTYQSVANEERDQLAVRVASETLKTWHKGIKFPIEPIPGGISEEAVEDWKALKEELGIECTAIERLVEESARTGSPRPSRDNRTRNRRSRFYNIYNTYVYGAGDKDGSSGGGSLLPSVGYFLFCVGASATVAILVGHTMAPQYSVPGGASYYDRAAWSSFNSIQAAGEGFPGDVAAGSAFWGFLGRLGGEAARTLRGWPT